MKALLLFLSLCSLSSMALGYSGADIETIIRDCTITKLGSDYGKLTNRLAQNTPMRIITTTNSDPQKPTIWRDGQHSLTMTAANRFVGTTSELREGKSPHGETRHIFTITAAPQNIVLHEPVNTRKGQAYVAELYVQTTTFKIADLRCSRW